MDITTILSSGVIAGAVAGFVTLRTSERKISIENITQQRQIWRDKIRQLAIDICSAYSRNERYKIKSYYIELQLLLNPDDGDDREILDTVWRMKEREVIEGLDIEFSEKISLLLKHDWERAKLEAKSSIIRIISAYRIPYSSFKYKRMPQKDCCEQTTSIDIEASTRTRGSLIENLKNLFIDDPKPIFDHFRNMGIASAFLLGAKSLKSLNIKNPPSFINVESVFAVLSGSVVAIASLLLVMNVCFAKKSIDSFFKKDCLDTCCMRLVPSIAWFLYTAIISIIFFMYMWGFIKN
ncbi:hypothetical protein MRK42_06960 [Aeromonas sp. 19NY04SH05-1]|uniref:Uncharacterized protein n=1 Tax=Aeromonas sp. 19NY04SH05-1 TaxID=2920537 RepID=A0AAU6TBW8_9GAMM